MPRSQPPQSTQGGSAGDLGHGKREILSLTLLRPDHGLSKAVDKGTLDYLLCGEPLPELLACFVMLLVNAVTTADLPCMGPLQPLSDGLIEGGTGAQRTAKCPHGPRSMWRSAGALRTGWPKTKLRSPLLGHKPSGPVD